MVYTKESMKKYYENNKDKLMQEKECKYCNCSVKGWNWYHHVQSKKHKYNTTKDPAMETILNKIAELEAKLSKTGNEN